MKKAAAQARAQADHTGTLPSGDHPTGKQKAQQHPQMLEAGATTMEATLL
jgi:hypothetical protein